MSELDAAWAALRAANAELGWTITRPSFDANRNEWVLWAFDPGTPPPAQKRRERLVRVPPEFGEVGAVREMASVLQQVIR